MSFSNLRYYSAVLRYFSLLSVFFRYFIGIFQYFLLFFQYFQLFCLYFCSISWYFLRSLPEKFFLKFFIEYCDAYQLGKTLTWRPLGCQPKIEPTFSVTLMLMVMKPQAELMLQQWYRRWSQCTTKQRNFPSSHRPVVPPPNDLLTSVNCRWRS